MKTNDARMSFGDHLEELRKRVIFSCVAIAVAFIVCLFFQSELVEVVCLPHRRAAEATGAMPKLVILEYPEGFLNFMKVCLIGAIVIASPFVLYQAWLFVSAGLYQHERRYVLIFLPFSITLFLGGVAFGYFVLIPIALKFLIGYAGRELVEPTIRFGTYLNMFFHLTLAVGLIFETPVIILFLTKVGVLSPESLAKHRKAAILIAFIVSAIITPPDLVSQIILALPFILLYEFGILLGRMTQKKKAREGLAG